MAVEEGKLSLDDIKEKMHDNPISIFGLPDQPDTYIEVEIDRKQIVPDVGFDNAFSKWSPVAQKFLGGFIHRVVVRGETVYLDGSFFGEKNGRDVSSVANIMSRTNLRIVSPARRPLGSFSESKDRSVKSSLATEHSPIRRQTMLEGIAEPKDEEMLEMHQKQKFKSFGLDSRGRSALPSSLSSSNSPFFKKNIVSVKNFSRPDLHLLFSVAQELRTLVERGTKIDYLEGKVMCSAFWEASTRTSCSFESAMYRLGGSVVSINEITSSITKGESMADTGKYYSI
jgi:carbamoyl-phosphate synthase/aspartate carbamoyltransferase